MRQFLYLIMMFAPCAWASPRLQIQPEVSSQYVFPSTVPSSSTPLLFSGTLGSAAAVWLTDDFFVGVTSQFIFTNQYSTVSSLVGNFRGTRWNVISPMIGWRVFSDLTFRTEFQFVGNYMLSNTAVGGQSLSYQNPIGVRMSVFYPIYKGLQLGAVFEYLSFASLFNSSTGSTTLGTRFAMWSYGLQVGYAFEFFK